MDLEKQTTITGPARAMFEMIIAASAQQCRDEMLRAMMQHACRGIIARLCLELSPKEIEDA